MLSLVRDSVEVGAQTLHWSVEGQCYLIEVGNWTFAVFQNEDDHSWAANVLKRGRYAWEGQDHDTPDDAAQELAEYLESGVEAFKFVLEG